MSLAITSTVSLTKARCQSMPSEANDFRVSYQAWSRVAERRFFIGLV